MATLNTTSGGYFFLLNKTRHLNVVNEQLERT